MMGLWVSIYDFTYRRYVINQESGVFYSFGFRYGPVSLKSNGVSENVGVKTKLSYDGHIQLELKQVIDVIFKRHKCRSHLGLQLTHF